MLPVLAAAQVPLPQACTAPEAVSGRAIADNASVDSLIRTAATQHPIVLGKLSDREAAQYGIKTAQQAYYPAPSLTRENASTSGSDPNYTASKSLTVVGLRQTLWAGGRLDAGKHYAEAQAESADASLREQRESVAMQVVAAHGDWLRFYRQATLTDASIEVHKALFDKADRRINTGASAEIDRQLTQSRMRQLIVDRSKLESSKLVALSRLQHLVGRTLVEADLVRMLDEPLCLSASGELTRRMIDRSPALARLRADLEAIDAQIDVKKAARFPEVYVRAERQYGNYTVADAKPQNRVFIGMQYQPGAGLAINTDIEAALKRRAASERTLEAARLELLDQFTSDWAEFQTLQERRLAAQESLANTRAVKESYERQYQAGRKSWLDVMNMVREQLQIELQLADLDASILALSRKLQVRASGLSDWGIS